MTRRQSTSPVIVSQIVSVHAHLKRFAFPEEYKSVVLRKLIHRSCYAGAWLIPAKQVQIYGHLSDSLAFASLRKFVQ